jgi:hypothetical protein
MRTRAHVGAWVPSTGRRANRWVALRSSGWHGAGHNERAGPFPSRLLEWNGAAG